MNKRIPDQDIMDSPGDAGTRIYPGGSEAVMSKLITLHQGSDYKLRLHSL